MKATVLVKLFQGCGNVKPQNGAIHFKNINLIAKYREVF